MIIVQDSGKNIIGLCSTTKRFLLQWNGKGASSGSYDYLRKKLKLAGANTIKYRDFFLTKLEPKRGGKGNFE